ncbi:MAG: thiol:disulfide interchange protein DsbA/DsbL [Burkholderiaceae bacterium]|nr:thiol:disulfide interchange protein DsbA/DsbL [Burkholderiaceae bacterium]MDP1967838.1 thiol:disulfide interchange protein DsbA/DsbL [Burkholderiaceae bacterium]
MKRRDFSLGAAGLLALPALTPAVAQSRTPDEGSDYLALKQRVPTEGAGKIEVIEFFWYNCPHCNAFEPRLEEWIKRIPKDVVVKRVPVAFRDDFVPQQRLFYTLEAMGKLDTLHRKVFNAIHVDRQNLQREDGIASWAAKQDLDRAKFMELYNSFSVSNKARRATQLQNLFRVEGVPALGIAGRYYTDATLAGSMERALQVTDYLIGQARKNP